MAKIEHVVIVVKENHTFDNYFSSFPRAEGVMLDIAPNPPDDDPHHKHQTWMARAGETTHQIQYRQGDIPANFAYARQFTLCDNYFSEAAGPSTPNHLTLICVDAPPANPGA